MYQFAVDRNLQVSSSESRSDSVFRLQPFDIVYVRTSANYEPQQQIFVYGEVMQPGNYAITNRQERIADIIQRAGGLKPSAYLAGAQFRRRGTLIGNDLRNLLADSTSEENLLLQSGDTLFVPRRSEIVTIEGAVLNPSSVSYKAEYDFEDYIGEGGGFTDNARSSKAYVIYPNGRKERTLPFLARGSLFKSSRPKVEPGSTIVVPFKPLDNNRISAAERIGILSLLTTVSIALVNILLR